MLLEKKGNVEVKNAFNCNMLIRYSLKAARDQSSACWQFTHNQRLTEWILSTTGTVARFVRIHLNGKNFLHLAEVEVFGVYNAFNYVGKVSSVRCANETTLVIMRPLAQERSISICIITEHEITYLLLP